jgi:hypothetical protein
VFVILRVKVGCIPEKKKRHIALEDLVGTTGWLYALRYLQNSVLGDAIEPLNWRCYHDAVTVPFR